MAKMCAAFVGGRAWRLPLAVLMLGAGTAHAQTHDGLLATLFQDHAVLQRDRPIVVWGAAGPGEAVTVSLASGTSHARADGKGHWTATLPALAAGGPYVLTAQSDAGARQSAGDVLLGDVFLCSGQSNMELPVERTGDAHNEIANSTNGTLRMLTVGHSDNVTPQSSFSAPVEWQSAAPETVPSWSAACFYFARELQKTLRVPIGLVHASWGGSNIRAWISGPAYRAMGGYDAGLDAEALYAKDPAAGQRRFAEQWQAWWRSKSGDRVGAEPWRADPDAGGADAARPASDRADGPASGNAVATHATSVTWQPAPDSLGDWRGWDPSLRSFTGSMWFRTRLNLTDSQAKSAVRLDLGRINQVDETWLNGRALGNTFGFDAERRYTLPPGALHAGVNVLVINVMSNYQQGGLLAGGARRALYLADGRSIALEGPWEYRTVPAAVGFPPRAPWESISGLSTLYNAMIAPLGAFGLRGVLWYQGESNTGEFGGYRGLLTALMADWRRQLGAELPFLVVQLPNYGPLPPNPAVESDWAGLREAQRAAVAGDAHAALVVTIDIGEPGNLHPTDKQDVGRRLAIAARHVVYRESIAASGPVARGALRAADGRVAVDFGDLERGLVAYGQDAPIGFEACGESTPSCRFATAEIDGTRVWVTAPASATHVRYDWADSPIGTLFDRSGLPAGPFELPVREASAAGHAVLGSRAVAAKASATDSATFAPDGAATITRVVPEPMSISAEARQWLDSLPASQHGPQTLAQRRQATDTWRARDAAEALQHYPVKIEATHIAGVPVDSIDPLDMPAANRHRVLLNLHGGGFNSDSGSRIEGDPIANLAKIEVVSVYYRLAPENPFPAAVDDVVAVYRELLKTYEPRNIGVFGTSAGGILTMEVAVKLRKLGLPLPGALGVLSALGDFSRVSDTRQLFTLDGLPGDLQPTDPSHLPDDAYVGKTDRRDPVLSPLFADLHGMPPTLFISGTRDMLLGDTANMQRAMLRAGVDARLVVFDALPHAFWYHFELPETDETLRLLASFMDEEVGR